MSNPLAILRDKRSEASMVSDYFDIPSAGSGTFVLRLLYTPLKDVVTEPSKTNAIVVREVDPITYLHNPGLHMVYSRIIAGIPDSYEYLEDADTYSFGLITMSFGGATGKTLEIIYQAQGVSNATTIVRNINVITVATPDGDFDLGTHGFILKSPSGNRALVKMDDDYALTMEPL